MNIKYVRGEERDDGPGVVLMCDTVYSAYGATVPGCARDSELWRAAEWRGPGGRLRDTETG